MILITVLVAWRAYSADCGLQREQKERNFRQRAVLLKGSRRMESSQMKMWNKGRVLVFIMEEFFLGADIE